MDLNNGSSHIPVPNPNSKESHMHDSNALNLPEARVPAQSEYESVFPVSKNGAEMMCAGVPGFVQSTNLDRLDRDLWAAGQSIEASRREPLCEQHRTLQNQHSHVCSDLANAQEGQRELQTVALTLENDRALKEAVELELQQTKDELSALEDWKAQELRSRDHTVDKLQESIKTKDDQLAHFAEKLKSLERQQNEILAETMGEYEAKLAKLRAESATREQASSNQRDQVAALSSELESARLFIQAFQEVQNEMDEKHSQALQQLQKENDSLRESLEAASSNSQLDANTHDLADQTETELQLLRDEHTSLTQKLETVQKSLVERFPDLHDNLDNLSVTPGCIMPAIYDGDYGTFEMRTRTVPGPKD
ncbi:hypothetical protein CEP54_015769 [Fusarium duplospermum]|uniref:Uncharacterized protein n=1 Tax=Fusarium duplospermum TaxID=1325734 RepID=A0A428NLE7_9HYPO|nr:hypothetical protein CEP54_015769 [Fusarium duplospermum]